MKCPECGKVMAHAGVLSSKEEEDFLFAETKCRCAEQAISSAKDCAELFSDGQLYEYFKASCDELAEGLFLREVFFKKISQRLSIPKNKIQIFEAEVFVHG